jgi:hypothetical protein
VRAPPGEAKACRLSICQAVTVSRDQSALRKWKKNRDAYDGA